MRNPRLPEFDASSPLRPARFGHIVVRALHYDRMVPWYKTVLNAEPLFELPVACFLTYDDEHHRVLVIKDPNPNARLRDEDTVGVAHWAYLFDSLSDLMTTYARLRGEGITPTYCVNHGFQFSLYYHDPDGNEVELGCDNFETREELNAWFDNGLFAANFYGFDFDPEQAYRWHEGGMSDEQIFAETYKGKAPDLGAIFEELK